MEPIKFEDNIREKLQEREVKPSKDAWNKLAKQLDSKSQKGINKSIWFAVAASFIGVIVVVSFLFEDEVIPSQNIPELVEETKVIIDEIPIENGSRVVIANEEPSNKVIQKIEPKKIKKKNKNSKRESITTNNIKKDTLKRTVLIKEDIAIAVVDKTELSIPVENSFEDNFINMKVDEVVAQVQFLKENDNSVSVDEINALLIKAQRDINSLKIVKNKKIDATALLNVVESELETSFRGKVFDALGDSFEKVRTAVVERNN